MNPAAPPAVVLSDVGRMFGTVAAVADVSLSVARGEIICLVGQSGCGKSTLLRLIAGVEAPDAGRIWLNGEEVCGQSRFVEPEDRKTGFVFQDYALFPHLTVAQNVCFGLKRRSKTDAGRIASDIIRRVGIEHLSDRYPHMLSGGEQQRVALARALAPRPDILLMDEPFSSLDKGLRDTIRDDTLALLKSLGATVVMVTHDPEEALSAGDRVVLMRAGRIVQVGTGYDLHDRPANAYAAEFFRAFNKAPGIYRGGFIETALGRFAHRLDVGDGSPATLYVPSQGISVSTEGGDFSGRIVARTFHGEFEQLLVGVEGLSDPLRVRTSVRLPAGADLVRLSIASERTLAFV